ncbi:MAG: DNA-binding protein [Bacteroidaceae bacterium]|nr:DNA-binding protein [Bacteroidaceae bacterium]
MINYSIAIMSAQPGTKKENITETKAYGVAQSSEVLDINAFANHITSHGCVYSKGDILAVLTIAVSCLRELILEGKRVKLGELGDFQAQLKTVGAKTADAFSASNIKEVNVSWTPGKSFLNLRDEATFQLVPTRAAQSSAIEVIKNQDTIQGLE